MTVKVDTDLETPIFIDTRVVEESESELKVVKDTKSEIGVEELEVEASY